MEINFRDFSILIVDDIPSNIQVLGKILQEYKFRINFATSGKQAIKLVDKSRPDLILLDISMPEMSGIDVCKHLKSRKETEDIPIIFLTALTDEDDIVAAFNAGGADYITKPFHSSELIARVRHHLTLVDSYRKLKDAYDIIESDLAAASQMQHHLIPPSSVQYNDVEFSNIFIPSVQVSGDTLNYYAIDKSHILFYMVDVAGHGVPSAFLAYTLSRWLDEDRSVDNPIYDIDNENLVINSPDRIVEILNKKFQVDPTTFNYFTMFLGIIDTDLKTIFYCQAGHTQPIIIRNKDDFEILNATGFPVGLLQEAEFELNTIKYEKGMRFIIYSDGITELRNDENKYFGTDRLAGIFLKNYEIPLSEQLDKLESEIVDFHGNKKFNDDVSLIIMKF